VFIRIRVLILALLVHEVAAAQAHRSDPRTSATPVGVLIGWVSQRGGPAAGSDSARNAEGSARSPLAATSETTLVDGRKFVHVNQTEKADPLSTLWIFLSGGKLTIRRVQHIIIPRRGGLWTLGMNTDSAGVDGSSADEDFFWVAPLGEKPTLSAIDPHDVGCSTSSVTRELTYVGPEYLGFSEFGAGICAHYDESHSLSVESIAAVYDARPRALRANAQGIALLGPRAVAEHGRLARLAKLWANECGAAGFNAPTTDWTIRRRRGHWEAAATFYGSGGGICGRYNEDRVLHTPLPHALVSPAAHLPVAWKTIRKLVPDATDATASPDGKLVIVLSPARVTVATVDGPALRPVTTPIDVAIATPVMLEWAQGRDAIRWNELLSTMPVAPP
jgi:hypothetical protein